MTSTLECNASKCILWMHAWVQTKNYFAGQPYRTKLRNQAGKIPRWTLWNDVYFDPRNNRFGKVLSCARNRTLSCVFM